MVRKLPEKRQQKTSDFSGRLQYKWRARQATSYKNTVAPVFFSEGGEVYLSYKRRSNLPHIRLRNE